MDSKPGPGPATDRKAPAGTASHGTVVYLNSSSIGRGDDALGAKLLGIFLDTLGHFAPRVSHLILINSGVRLACTGSPVLEQLRVLATADIEILACGTCLNHFDITDQMQVGRLSNMMEIIEVQTRAQRIIIP